MATEITFEQAQVETFRAVKKRIKDDESPRSDRPHLVAILPRGEAIRNFVYTGALDEVARDAEVTLLSVIPSREVNDLLCARYQRVFPLREIEERRIVGSLRELLNTAHGRWLWSKAAEERWRLRDLEANTSGLRLKRWAKKIACYPFNSSASLNLLSSIERISSRLLRTTDEYVRLFRELQPSLVFNTDSHVHFLLGQPHVAGQDHPAL